MRLEKKAVFGIMLTFLLTSMLTLVFNIQLVKGWTGTVYIRADGRIDPPTAPIQRIANTYTFTDNINGSIVVERDNIIVDGGGYTLQGTGASFSRGVDLSGRTNVIVRNIHIENFHYGIYLSSSRNNSITRCNITANKQYGVGIYLSSISTNNNITGNIITNTYAGIYPYHSNNNVVNGNNLTNNDMGVFIYDSDGTVISGNSITNNDIGIYNGGQIWYSRFTIISENTITNNNEDGIFFLNSDSCEVSGNRITNNRYGIYLYSSSYIIIRENSITNNVYGVLCFKSSNNGVYQNDFIGNSVGIYPFSSSNSNSISGNNIKNNSCGIYLYSSSRNNINANNIVASYGSGIFLNYSHNNNIMENNITNSARGIRLSSSDNNNVSRNNVANNQYSIQLEYSSYNKFHHNNFIDNDKQVLSDTSPNSWDDDYPSGGNYWSDYGGVDNNGDGIGDMPYAIDAYNRDRYPLMSQLRSFEVEHWDGLTYDIDVVSNSTISDFKFTPSLTPETPSTISLNVSGLENTMGFCRITIPNKIVQDFWQNNFTVLLNGEPHLFKNWTDTQNTYIYVNYPHSQHQIIIIPEFASALILWMFFSSTLVATFLFKKKRKAKPYLP